MFKNGELVKLHFDNTIYKVIKLWIKDNKELIYLLYNIEVPSNDSNDLEKFWDYSIFTNESNLIPIKYLQLTLF